MELLKNGSRGERVKHMQKVLNLYPDGIFGSLTEEGVKAFQCEHGLHVDGIVGEKTWNLICNMSAFDANRDTLVKKSARLIKEIIIHCSATKEGEYHSVEDIRKWHKQRGWSDIGYHYVIYLDGSIHVGRDVSLAGAHTLNHNSHSIGICYIGGLAADGKTAKDTRTEKQRESLKLLVSLCKAYYPDARILGHRDASPDKNKNGKIESWEWVKDCPSFDAMSEYSNI